ncbi:MAG: hypothetical protein A3K67_07620 [Euryarchaeota archaeon RBG_16_62_10]|nr:MAG: hypothetical protein A3K67_07620 [Euryarchaeota archaeon RBG_16_62_10]
MCTTYLAALMLEELSGYDLVGLPRLVRLNPNVPWKTRGNAAICLPLGHASGAGRVCGGLGSVPVKCYERGKQCDHEELLAAASKVLERAAMFECDKTNPGIVASNARPPPSLYWKAVRGVVELGDVERMLGRSGACWKKYKNGRGVIGASAAMAWRPRDRTWEVIAYRAPDKVGTPREVDPESVIAMDKATRWTFNNYDFENGHIAIAPGSPCPILFGIRGDSAAELLRAKDMIGGERPHMWLEFLTNQATEDHIALRKVRDLVPWTSAKVRVRVVSSPRTIVGGHVVLRVGDGSEVDAMFYEPSRGFRDVARALIPGDRITLFGSVRDVPRSLNVEKMHVDGLVEDRRKAHNPVCKACGKSMGSLGRGQGYRCKRCGAKAGPEAAEYEAVPRLAKVGWYEPPVASRRHLHKPLRRMSRLNIDNL